MNRLRSLLTWTTIRPARLLIFPAILVMFGVPILAGVGQAAPANQPIAFNHQIMVQAGMTCEFCHSGVERSPAAGMPSVEKCMGCHKVIDPKNAEILKVADYWNRKVPIPWVRVNVLPRFVYFSHQVHVVAGGRKCEDCHGDVGHMTIDVPVVRMNMGWCLDCHSKQPNAEQLRDCIVCHQ